MRKAIEDFLYAVNQKGAASVKHSGQLSGIGGGPLDWLESAYNTVKSGVQTVVKYGQDIFGTETGYTGPYQVQPTIEIPAGLIQTQVTPQAAAAGVEAILSSPVFIGLAVIGVALLLSGRKRR